MCRLIVLKECLEEQDLKDLTPHYCKEGIPFLQGIILFSCLLSVINYLAYSVLARIKLYCEFSAIVIELEF